MKAFEFVKHAGVAQQLYKFSGVGLRLNKWLSKACVGGCAKGGFGKFYYAVVVAKLFSGINWG